MTKSRKIAIALVSFLLVLVLLGILGVLLVFFKPKPEAVEKVKYSKQGTGILLTADNSEYASGDFLLVNGDTVTFHCYEGTGQARITSFELIYCEKVGD